MPHTNERAANIHILRRVGKGYPISSIDNLSKPDPLYLEAGGCFRKLFSRNSAGVPLVGWRVITQDTAYRSHAHPGPGACKFFCATQYLNMSSPSFAAFLSIPATTRPKWRIPTGIPNSPAKRAAQEPPASHPARQTERRTYNNPTVL